MTDQPLRFEPIAIADLWSIQPDRTRSLQQVAHALLPEANEALEDLRTGRLTGAAVLVP